MHATPIPILSDNYAWLLECARTGTLGVVDPAEAAPVIRAIERRIAETGARLDAVLLTHHHDDHIAEAEAVARHLGAAIVGAAADRHRLPPLDRAVAEADRFSLGETTLVVIETPGHTVGHVSFHALPTGPDDAPVLACGDTLFSLGCGRLFEGTPAQMHASLARLASLAHETLVACGHEYTATNAAYALTVDPDNADLLARVDEVRRQRSDGRPTLPVTIGLERATNPFLRVPDVDGFAKLRRGRDGFRA